MFNLAIDNREDLEVLADVLELQRARSSGKAPAVDRTIDILFARVKIQLLLLDMGKEIVEAHSTYASRESRLVSPCPCECNKGGFCGGCGHAGCGGR